MDNLPNIKRKTKGRWFNRDLKLGNNHGGVGRHMPERRAPKTGETHAEKMMRKFFRRQEPMEPVLHQPIQPNVSCHGRTEKDARPGYPEFNQAMRT